MSKRQNVHRIENRGQDATTGRVRGIMFDTLQKASSGDITMAECNAISKGVSHINQNMAIELKAREQAIRFGDLPEGFGDLGVA